MRVKSLKTLEKRSNYEAAQSFFEELQNDSTLDCGIYAKAVGFSKQLESFEFYFMLNFMIAIFDRIELLNASLQKSNLNVHEAHGKVQAVMEAFTQIREKSFETVWNEATTNASNLGLEEPKLPRIRKIPRRLENEGAVSGHVFHTPKNHYKKIYFEVYDQVIVSLNERFSSRTMDFLNLIENVAIRQDESDIERIVSVYKTDFDADKLRLHRVMFFDIVAARNIKISTLNDVVAILQQDPTVRELVSEYTKVIKLLLTIPATSCTAERSFSALRRLKTYLRSTMLQILLNSTAVLHVHSDVAKSLNMDSLMNEFIRRNKIRSATFALK